MKRTVKFDCNESTSAAESVAQHLYLEVHRVDVGGDEITDEEEKMENQLSRKKVLEVRIASQDVGEENFEDRRWFRWFVCLT